MSNVFRLIGGAWKLSTGLGLLAFGVFVLYMQLIDNPNALKENKIFLEEGIEQKAALSEFSDKTDVTIKGVDIKYYVTKYRFKVDGQLYTGSVQTDTLPNIELVDSIPILYLPSNPNINSANAEAEYNDALEDSQSVLFIWLGIISIFISLLFLFFGFKQFMKGIRSKNKT